MVNMEIDVEMNDAEPRYTDEEMREESLILSYTNDENDSDDPIVDEKPILILPSQSLHLFQFPTSSSMPAHLNSIGKLKRNSKKIQLKTDLYLSNGHYDQGAAMQFGQGLDNNAIQTVYDIRRGLASKEPQKPLDSITLESTKMPLNATYFTGRLIEGQLVLRPIDSVLQFRPKLEYLDRIQEKEKQANQRLADEERETISKKEAEARVVSVSVRSQDKESMEKASIAQLRQAAENEPWVNLSVYREESSESMHLKSKLFYPTEREDADVLPTNDYFNKICPELSDSLADIRPKISGPADTQLEKARLRIRLQKWLCNAHVVNHSTVLDIFSQYSETALLEALQQFAILIQGLWVVRSEFLYSGRMCTARNYLLYLFSQHHSISREKFCQVTKVDHTTSHALFGEIACLDRKTRMWTLKLMPDEVVSEEYQDLVNWSTPILQEFLQKSQLEFGRSYNSDQEESMSPVSVQSPVQSGPSFEHKRKLIMKSIQMHPVFSQGALLNHLRKQKLIEYDQDEKIVLELLDEVSVPRDSDTRILTKAGLADLDVFLPTAAKLFAERGKVKKADLNAVWTDALGKVPNGQLYTRILQFLASSRGGVWVLLSPVTAYEL